MAQALTTGSRITCPHQGMFATTSTAKLKVSGQPVLKAPDATSWVATGCTQTGGPPTPCTNIASLASGQLMKLKLGGAPALGSGAAGMTTGGPPGPVSVVPMQTKLTAT
jgi:hypothetical protein